MTKEEKLRLLDNAIETLLNRQRDLERELDQERRNRAADQRIIEQLENRIESLEYELSVKQNEKSSLFDF